MPSLRITDWFDEFVRWLDEPNVLALDSGGTPAMFILEALSDASNELMAVAVAAAHLRRFGRRRFEGRRFWSRSEWGKWDLTYGVADQPFAGGWNHEWNRGRAGELGVIEAKVTYSTESSFDGKLAELDRQLRDRADWYVRDGGDASSFGVHGLIFFLDWCNDDSRWERLTERVAGQAAATCSSSLPADRLETLWPFEYERGARLRLLLLSHCRVPTPTGA